MATALQVPYADIQASESTFDLNSVLTREEQEMMGVIVASMPKEAPVLKSPVLKDLEDVDDEPAVDAVEAVTDGSAYNQRYAHYMRCQALAALVAFDEGWKAFEDLVLKVYLLARRRENKDYKGDDPNKAFSLRIREQTAEDFMKFIHAMLAEAVNTPKPSIAAKK